jgi:hypothetical protein
VGRQALCAGLTDVLGPDLTASRMSFLPIQPATDLATKAHIEGLSRQVVELATRPVYSEATTGSLSVAASRNVVTTSTTKLVRAIPKK